MTIGETVSMVENNSNWKTTLLVGNTNVKFKIDTGADVSVFPEDIFRRCKLGRLQSNLEKAIRGRSKRSTRYWRNSREFEAWRNLRDRGYLCRQRS